MDGLTTPTIQSPCGKLFINALCVGDIGEKYAERTFVEAVEGNFNYQQDAISGIIIDAFLNHSFCDSEDSKDDAIQDLEYAISQLKRAKSVIEKSI